MTTMIPVTVEQALALVFVAALLLGGYSKRGKGVLGWPMFTSHCAVVADLRVGTDEGEQQTVDMFAHLPSDRMWINPREFDQLLSYLARTGSVHGTGTFYGNSHVYNLEIADCRVDVTSVRG